MEELMLLVHKRLSGAAEDIFGLFKAATEKYEVAVSRLLEENKRQRTLLDRCRVHLHGADVPHLKEELLSCPAGSVPVNEVQEEKAPSSQLHQAQADRNRAARSSSQQMGPDSNRRSEADMLDNGEALTSDETEDSEDYCKGSPPKPSKFMLLKDNEVGSAPPKITDQTFQVKTSDSSNDETEDSEDERGQEKFPASFSECQTHETTFICSTYNQRFHTHSGHSDKHMRSRAREGVSKKRDSGSLKTVEEHNAEGTSFMCFICDKTFQKKSHLNLHMRIHRVRTSKCSV